MAGRPVGYRFPTCRRGHEWTPDNTYVNPTSGKRQCRTCLDVSVKTYAKEHRAEANASKRRERERKGREPDRARRFGLTMAELAALKVAQNNLCAICEKPCSSGRNLAIDHDHAHCAGREACGDCVRGLLCTYCNSRLATLEDLEWRTKAEAFLASPPAPHILAALRQGIAA